MGKIVTDSVTASITKRISSQPEGWCFTVHDFLDLGSNDAVRQILSRLARTGRVIRVCTGVYSSLRFHEIFGELPTQLEAVIDALKRAHQIRCQPSGALAANLLGLSTQVPAKVTVLTDGPSKTLQVGNRTIIFKKTTPKIMAMSGTVTGLIVQAIKHIGREHISHEHFTRLKKQLSPTDITEIKKNVYLAPAWIAELINTELVGY